MRTNIPDIIGVIGMVGICTGVFMLNRPAAIILTGIFCVIVSLGMYLSRRQGGSK